MADRDLMDELLDQWRRERPDLGDEGLQAMGILSRVTRISTALGPLIERPFVARGLARGEYEVLAALRHAGDPFTLTPSAMAHLLLLSPGAMTNRLDRLEAVGHVHREHDTRNRRRVLVTLTSQGRSVVDEALDAHVANELSLLKQLSDSDRIELDQALRTLQAALDAS